MDFPKDRYFQVCKRNEPAEDWNELLKRIKECLAVSFSRQIKEYRSEVKNLIERINIPGWNFCNYFIVKEGLAFTLIQCNQLENAIDIYNQLEELYESLLRNLSFETLLFSIIYNFIFQSTSGK